MLTSIIYVAFTLIVAGKRHKEKYDYGITIDAGSRHTGLFVFRWLKRIIKDYSTRPRSQPECPVGWSMKIHPGVAQYAYETDPHSRGLEKYLSPLFSFAKKKLDGHDISKIPVFFGATAGMRLVTYPNRQPLMNRIRSYISSSGFKFHNSQAHVLSGEEEAMYNWVNVNNLNGFYGGDAGSIGVLDMGGASLEAAYETPYDILDGWIAVQLFEQRYRLYGRSYLQLGVKEAFRRIILETEEVLMRTNPCVPTGCIVNYSDPDSGFNKTLIGSSQQGTCSQFVQSIIQASIPCHYPMDPSGKSECHAYGQYAPPQFSNMTFYGIDGFLDFTKELQLYRELKQDKHSTAMSLPVIKKYADILCMTAWEDLKLRFKKTDEDFLATACFLGSFIYGILTTGLGFSNDFENFIFADRVDGKPLGWAPGLMLYKVDKMPIFCPSCAVVSRGLKMAVHEPRLVEDDPVGSELVHFSEFTGAISIITVVAVVLFGVVACLKCEAYVMDHLVRHSTSYTQIPEKD